MPMNVLQQQRRSVRILPIGQCAASLLGLLRVPRAGAWMVIILVSKERNNQGALVWYEYRLTDHGYPDCEARLLVTLSIGLSQSG